MRQPTRPGRLRAIATRSGRLRGPGPVERALYASKPPSWPTSCFILCGTARTGTSYLADLLASTGSVGLAQEYFAAKGEPGWAAANYRDYVAFIKRVRARNGVFGTKLLWFQLERMLPLLRASVPRGDALRDSEILDRFFPSAPYIWMRRADLVAQAVSWSKAEQSDHWVSLDEPGSAREPVFDFDHVHQFVLLAARRNEQWRTWFAANEIEPFSILYEDLDADPVGVTRQVLDFLGVSVPDSVEIASRVERQADGTNATWIARYCELAARRGIARPEGHQVA